ncbi:MAG: sigma-70 family RNA polymerase sigma factor [Oscillospiraceae bacterium]|nr:sigma-70 family RNA polymerase sigma factor [Oscillospiraceae bacterium]
MADFDEQLRRAKARDEAALAYMIAREMPLIRRTARKMTAPGLDFEDAVQEGIIGLFRAIETYDSTRVSSFTTYAAACIRNAVITAARTAGRKRNQPLNSSVPFDEEPFTEGPEQIAIDNEAYRLTVHRINTALSPFESKVLRCKLAGASSKEIAARLGCEKKTADNALWRIRQKLKR